jgi:hypothetical protein
MMDGINVQNKLERLSAKLDRVLASSPLVTGLRKLAQAQTQLHAGRPLSSGERLYLESQGNTCADWSRIRIIGDTGLDTIRNNWLEGDILFAGFKGEWASPDGRTWPAGMANCRVRDAVIGNACLYQIARLERQIIENGAIVVGLGELDCPAPTLFSLGQAIHPGTESGARSVWIWDELTLDDCMDALSLTTPDQRIFQQKLDNALLPLTCTFGFVGSGAAVLHARHVHSAWIGPGTTISGASLIREAALLSTPEEPCVVSEEGWIEHALLQPGARVESSGKVSRSILLEHSAVTWGGMVFQSVVGPNTLVNKGEMNASLVGPFVGFHHQSLLISAIWPEGRGNIAYGANVGSNHTGKKPDQEIRPGEGNFFGLGCSIKYPANYDEAPYSIFATGVTTLPQRLTFPFTLINQPLSSFPELGPAINEIVPGWMWSDNAYALVRRSYKFEDSNQARRHAFSADPTSTLPSGFFTSRIFLPSMAKMVLKAFLCLRAAPPDMPYYLEENLPGIGKNFLRGKILERAIGAYEDYLIFFLMRIFADHARSNWPQDLIPLINTIAKAVHMPGDGKAFLAEQKPRLAAFKASILDSLGRDDRRGRQIFDDYGDFHTSPEADGTIARLSEDLAALTKRLDVFLKSS